MSDLTSLDALLDHLPSGWFGPPIRNVAQLINGRGFKPYEWETDGLPIIRIQNLNGSPEFNYYSGSYNPKIEVENGDLLFAWSGSRGTSFGPHFWNGPRGVLNYHTWKVKVDERAISPDFFYHALRFLTRIIEDRAHGASALVHVQKWEMEKFGFPCPKDRAEQHAIAAALSDADGVVAGLERVIAKKRLIKQGAMQDLLTARRRLPGFSREWGEASLGSVLRRSPSYGINAPAMPRGTGGFAYLRITDISDDGAVDPSGLPSVREGASDDYLLMAGDIVVARTGASVGKSHLFRDIGEPVIFAGFLIRLSPDETKIVSAFLSQYMQTKEYWDWVRENSARSGQPGVNGQQLRTISLKLPQIDEQQAIAAVLCDMDAEIQTLESRLTKAKAVKEGMMQNLLTGRVRLV